MLPLCAYGGHRIGRASREAALARDGIGKAVVGESLNSAMMALLGLFLAFTFSFAQSRAGDRRHAQIEEVAAIGTAFLQADPVAEAGRTALREALAAHAEIRILEETGLVRPTEREAVLSETLAAQAVLWPTAMAATGGATPAPIRAAVARGITDVLDARTRRYAAGVQFVPLVAKAMILCAACTALTVASNSAALQGRALTWRTFLFAGLCWRRC